MINIHGIDREDSLQYWFASITKGTKTNYKSSYPTPGLSYSYSFYPITIATAIV